MLIVNSQCGWENGEQHKAPHRTSVNTSSRMKHKCRTFFFLVHAHVARVYFLFKFGVVHLLFIKFFPSLQKSIAVARFVSTSSMPSLCS